MKRFFSIFLVLNLLLVLLCGCKDTETTSSNITTNSDVQNPFSEDKSEFNQNNTDSIQLYMQFLNGEISAKDSDGMFKQINEFAIYGELPQDYRYTFFDVNFDGEKELCVGEYKYILCFRMIDGEICYYETLTNTNLLSNRALLYDHSSPGYEQYVYRAPDEFEVNFEHLTYERENKEEYYIGAALVTKEEYDEKLGKYLSITEVDWYDRYGNVVVNSPEVHDKMLSIMLNKSTYINENGKSIYFSESASDSYADDLIAKPKQFSYFDIDRDGEREMVVGITLGSEYVDHYVILDHDDGNIYGHLLGIRSLQMLKEDGTFNQSGGAGTNQIARLTLDKTEIKFIVLAENIEMDGIYKIDGKDVSKEEIDAYHDQFNSKEDCNWFDVETFNLIE